MRGALLLPLFCLPALAGETSLTPDELLKDLPALLEKGPPAPQVSEVQLVQLEEEDPQTYVMLSYAKTHPPRALNLGGDGRLTLYRQSTGERVSAVYRRKNRYDRRGLSKLDRALRCVADGKSAEMALKLYEILDAVEDKFGGGGLIILSGYRTPSYNKYVPGSAKWSLHMLGWASDIRVPGHSAAQVAAFASRMKQGGVGYYPDASFVHLDAGTPRYWKARAGRKAAR